MGKPKGLERHKIFFRFPPPPPPPPTARSAPNIKIRPICICVGTKTIQIVRLTTRRWRYSCVSDQVATWWESRPLALQTKSTPGLVTKRSSGPPRNGAAPFSMDCWSSYLKLQPRRCILGMSWKSFAKEQVDIVLFELHVEPFQTS